MKPVVSGETWDLYRGDSLEVLRTFDDACIDAVVCDPPYGLSKEPDIVEVLTRWLAGEDYEARGGGFMGKTWDSFVPGPSIWREVFRVLKPGGHVLAFYGTRTYDLGVIAMRLAGFEIRDELAWMMGSGFPKNLDVAYECHKKAAAAAEHDMRFVLGSHLQTAVHACQECGQVLLARMSEQDAQIRWRAWSEPKVAGAKQPCMEGWSHVEAPEGQLPWCAVCTMSHGILADGAQRRVHHGAPSRDGADDRPAALAHGSGTPYRSRSEQQQPGEPDAVFFERRAQALRGTGTALKPAHEPIVLARKPLIGTVAANVLAHGTGGINVDACRIGIDPDEREIIDRRSGVGMGTIQCAHAGRGEGERFTSHSQGRWPANVLLDETAAALLDGQSGTLKSGRLGPGHKQGSGATSFQGMNGDNVIAREYGNDSGGASRFFYVAKTAKKEREAGLDHLPIRTGGELTDRQDGSDGLNGPRAGAGRKGGRRNTHPTVKPIELMRWLVRLITPPGGIVLDPFMGSGSTGCAAVLEGFRFAGIDLDQDKDGNPAGYITIAAARIEHWSGVLRTLAKERS